MKKIIKKIKKPISNIIQTGKLVIQGSNDYPPNVKKIMSQYGAQIIKAITLKRTPVDKALTGALNLFSLGKFGERFEKSFDELFHLFMEIETQGGTRLTLEKIERINMEVNPKSRPDEETKSVPNIPSGISVNQLLENARKKMGSQFFQYDAVVNNCQDFLLNVLKASGIGSEADYQFIKQDTAKLFKGMPVLKGIAHTATELGERANIIKQGGALTQSANIKNYGMILEHLVSHIKDPNEPIDPKDYRQGIKLINVIKQLKKGELKGSGLKKKSLMVQSIVFPKDEWGVARAKKWLKEHNYKGLSVDRKPSTLRFRQENPDNFTNFKMKTLPNGIMLVLANEKKISGSGMKTKKMFELFKGTGSVGKVADKMGYEVVSLDFDPAYTPDIETDILKWKYKDWYKEHHFIPDVIWASPPCNTFSPLAYPLKERDTKTAEPKSDRAKEGTKILHKTLEIIKFFKSLNPNLKYIVENPRGMMRNDKKILKIPHRATATYCSYGDKKFKPTDFWSNYEIELKDLGEDCKKWVPVQEIRKIEDRYSIPSRLIKSILEQIK